MPLIVTEKFAPTYKELQINVVKEKQLLKKKRENAPQPTNAKTLYAPIFLKIKNTEKND